MVTPNQGNNILNTVGTSSHRPRVTREAVCPVADFTPTFSKRGLLDMRVHDNVRKCVLFIGIKENGKFLPRATGFLVSHEEYGMRLGFLVTAQHVVSGLLTRGYDIWVRDNLKDGTATESKLPNGWHFHPNVPRETDVAAINVVMSPDSDTWAIPLNGERAAIATNDVMKRRFIGIGDDVCVVGLFRSHYGVDHNVPIARIGNLAVVQEEPVHTRYCGYIDAHLIEARSIAGLSGSPVFVMLPPTRIIDGFPIPTQGPILFLLGLMHGHFDVQNMTEDVVLEDGVTGGSINTGIGVVIPVEKILETINEQSWAEERRDAIIAHRKSSGAAVADVGIPGEGSSAAEG